MNDSINNHKVHHSLIEPAELAGIKLKWFGGIVLIAFVLFPLTGGSLLGFISLAVLIWALLQFVLKPLYRWDHDAIMVLLQTIIQKQYFQSGDYIKGPPKPSYDSIPKPK